MNDFRENDPRNTAAPPEERPVAAQAEPFGAVPSRDAAGPRHSGIGIASSVLGIIALILCAISFSMFITDALNIADEVESVAAMTEDQALDLLTRYPGLIGGVLLFLASGFLFFIGAILGIISLFSQNRKKLFPILGTVLNAFPIAVMILLTAGITMIG